MARNVRRPWWPVVALSLLGCSSEGTPGPADTGAPEDTGAPADTASLDAVADAGAPDVAPPDVPPDLAPADADPGDVGPRDAPSPLDVPARDAPLDVRADAPADAPRDVPGDTDAGAREAFDWVGIVGTGQSLSVGSAGAPVISTTQPGGHLKLLDRGTEPLYDGVGDRLSLVPLVEPVRPAFAGYPAVVYPNNVRGETPHTAMSLQLGALARAAGLREPVTLHSVVGEGGRSITAIRRGGTGRAYASTLYEGRAFVGLARAASRTFGYGAILLTHGEADATRTTYADDVYALFRDYNSDLRALTGQRRAIPLFLSQQSTVPATAGTLPVSAIAQWRVGVEHPGEVICVGPKYQYRYAADGIHLDAYGYRRLGIKYAQVYFETVVRGRPWRPLQPRAARREGRVLRVDFDVPVPPLAWDTTIAPPHRAAYTQWAEGRGFEVEDSTGRLVIESVRIAGDAVEVTLARAPTGAGLVVRYAAIQDATGVMGGPATGRRGQLCDSDPFVGYDRATIRCQVTRGSATVRAATAGAFAQRGVRDVVAGAGLAADTVAVARPAADTFQLSRAWTGETGTTDLVFHSDQRNYGVHFELRVP